jgi:hypothetical protein
MARSSPLAASSSELVDAGLEVSMAAQREGHGPHMPVNHYARGQVTAQCNTAAQFGSRPAALATITSIGEQRACQVDDGRETPRPPDGAGTEILRPTA